MDIEKEREAFECEFKQTDYYIAHGDLSTIMLCDDQYALDDVQVSFEMWQAAKAQAVQEGFILVPKKPDVSKALNIALKRIVPPPKTNDLIQKELMSKKYVDDLCSERDRILLNYEEMIEAQEKTQ